MNTRLLFNDFLTVDFAHIFFNAALVSSAILCVLSEMSFYITSYV